MSTVYQHQLHAHKPRRRHYKRWIATAVVLAAGIFWGLHLLKPDTKIQNAKTVSHKLTGTSATQTFTEGIFTIALPKGWTYLGEQKDVYDIFHFKGPKDPDNGNRLLDVYQDSSLPRFAINRMVPVEATDDGGLTADSTEVSDNCTAYTTGSAADSATGAELAKWQGIDFLCDMANSLRNVVGTGSTDGLNTVAVKTQTSTLHHYFFTYTENNDKADYNIFVAALNSFKLIQ